LIKVHERASAFISGFPFLLVRMWMTQLFLAFSRLSRFYIPFVISADSAVLLPGCRSSHVLP